MRFNLSYLVVGALVFMTESGVTAHQANNLSGRAANNKHGDVLAGHARSHIHARNMANHGGASGGGFQWGAGGSKGKGDGEDCGDHSEVSSSCMHLVSISTVLTSLLLPSAHAVTATAAAAANHLRLLPHRPRLLRSLASRMVLAVVVTPR